jgi:voltage-gated potassium channel
MERTDIDLNELKNINYELFLVAITILSVINIFLIYFAPTAVMRNVVMLVDFSICFLFLIDFVYRFFTASSKAYYFLRQYGWLDLLGSLPIPFIRLARLVRSGRTVRILRQYGVENLGSELRMDRAGSTLLSVAFLGILVLEFGSYFILGAEAGAADANIKTPSDALWWSVVTIATVGYGDRYPVTDQGRIIGTIVIITGVGLFGAFTGFLANSFINRRRRRHHFGSQAAEEPVDPLDEIKQMLEEQAQRLAAIEARLPPPPE